jgi:hypothetical protein
VIEMTDMVRTIEGLTLVNGTDGTPGSSDTSDTAPRRVYSLDGLLALALAVRELEETG